MENIKRIFLFISITFLNTCWISMTYSQDSSLDSVWNYSNPGEFEIGGIEVNGASQTDAQALISLSGLRIGNKVKVPGTDISNAIKSLWKLQLFTDIQISKTKTIGDVVFLEIKVKESPRLNRFSFSGIKKSKQDEHKELVAKYLVKGTLVTENAKRNARKAIEDYYTEKGYPSASITFIQQLDKDLSNQVNLLIKINQGPRTKVDNIHFTGNQSVSSKKLRKLLGVKRKKAWFTASKLIPEEVEAGKQLIIQYYNTIGYRDAKITKDSVWWNDAKDWVLEFAIQEGSPYYFGKIEWEGNSIHDEDILNRVLGIKTGEVYNKELLETRLRFSPDGQDVSTLYMDDGYLFFQLDYIEKAIIQDTIDLEIRIFEGPQAIVDKVTIKGNRVTNEEVIRRQLRTQPGKKFSRSDIIRSQREIINLGYFNPEKLDIKTDVNPDRGTVDIEYKLEEKNSDQFELSAGWGGSGVGVTGTVGVTLNNFSMRNLFNKSSWRPFPTGDGQKLSFRIQTTGPTFQSYNLSFTEPWLGKKQPSSLTVAGFFNRYAFGEGSEGTREEFQVLGIQASLGKPLKFPDDNFVYSASLGFNQYNLENWTRGFFKTDDGEFVSDGNFYKLSLKQTLARSTINHPIFPTDGSKFSFSLELTPPYSLFSNKDYSDQSASEKFKFLEYYKARIDAEWYTTLVGKLVLKASAKFGLLGAYNSALGTSPFERFQIGGDPLSNNIGGFIGTDIISLRGYEVTDLENNILNGETTATPLFDKFTLELRYPISLNPSATIYTLAFLEGGNSWQSFDSFNPFDIKRSAGLGLRVYLPMFGLLGFDYGLGFDKDGPASFSNYGRFSVILGFEPD